MEVSCYNVCFYSSFVFLINVIVAFYYKYYLYAFVFMLLIVTSLCHHSHYTEVTRIIDKIAVYLVVFYGGYLFFSKLRKLRNNTEPISKREWILSLLIVSTFLSTILLYYYGYITSSLCYCDNSSSANYFHSFMHCVGCAGHCCIALL